jgi:translation initiation factor IF-1
MSGEAAFKIEGVVIEVLPNKTYRVELSNGHRVVGFVSGRVRLNFVRFALGDRVKLQVSPYDLSEGRIVG